MIKSVRVVNSVNDELELVLTNPEQSGFFIKYIDGLGPVKANINYTTPVGIDGIYYNSAKALHRNIVMSLGFLNNGQFDIETQRQLTYKYFPLKKKIYFEITTDNRTLYTTGYVESNEPNIFSREQDTQISIICESSWLSGLSDDLDVLSGVVGAFEFPYSNESTSTPLTEFGEIFTSTSKNIDYAGDVPTGIVMRIGIQGAVEDLTIFNHTAGTSMTIDEAAITTITGAPFTSGDVLTISTLKGAKYVYLERGPYLYNVFNSIQNSYSWFELYPGQNEFAYAASTGIENVQFSVTHRPLYEGI